MMRDGEKTVWGVIGAGEILRRWIKGARQAEGTEIRAVASRSIVSARKAAAELGIPEALTIEELLSREDIKAVYIAVPHNAHREMAVRALEAGKHVLLEKPAAVNAVEFREIAACAARQHRFLMEAVWTRFFPLMKTLREILDSGEIGDVRIIQSAFAFRSSPEYGSGRLFDPERAGGGLLDVGVYNLHFADLVLQKEPLQLTGFASMDTDELHIQVDEQAVCLARYDRGELAVMTSAIRTDVPDNALICGTKGQILIPEFWRPVRMQVTARGKTREISMPVPQNVPGEPDEGFQYEIRHVSECIRAGLTESPVMPWEKSLHILQQCDSLRAQWGLVYPFEKGSGMPQAETKNRELI